MGVPVAAAIIIGLVCSFIQSLGLTIQRKSHVQEDLLPVPSRRRPIRRPLWLIGFFIYITSNIFSTIFQLDALPIVILAPLGAVSLIFNALLAKVILGDVFGSTAIMGTGLVTAGAILIAVFGVVKEEEHPLEELLRLWSRGPFLAFFSIMCASTVIVLISAHIASWHVSRQLRTGRIALPGAETPPPSSSICPSNYASPRSPPAIPFKPSGGFTSRRWSSPIVANIALPNDTGESSPDEPLLQAKRGVRFSKSPPGHLSISLPPSDPYVPVPTVSQQKTLTLVGLAFAAAAGTLSGMSLVLAKSAVELLVISIDHFRTGKGENEFAKIQTWFLVIGLVVGALLQLVYLNYSLTFASPALVCPLAFCFFNMSSIFDGLVFYDQIGQLKPYQIALVSVGVAILLLGVWVVSLIQPEGSGGVEVGTWVEEDSHSDCDSLAGDQGDQFGHESGPMSEEPDPMEAADTASPSPPAQYPQPGSSSPTQSPTHHRSRWSLSSPNPDQALQSPLSPASPSGRRRHRGPRYGTLIPDYDHSHIAPTGFSIGLGAASPGFVLRSPSISGPSGSHRRGRTQSEGQAGLLGIMRGSPSQPSTPNPDTNAEAEGEARTTTESPDRRRSWWQGIMGEQQGQIRLPDSDTNT